VEYKGAALASEALLTSLANGDSLTFVIDVTLGRGKSPKVKALEIAEKEKKKDEKLAEKERKKDDKVDKKKEKK